MGPPWHCGERASYSRWYELRSAVAHGDDDPVTSDEADQAEYWIFMWTLEPVLQWLVEHPVKPLEALDEALAALGPVPHWQKPVPNPAAYNPDDYGKGDHDEWERQWRALGCPRPDEIVFPGKI